ncbi:hypothetical protein Bbelb_383380 [Branchiostoma belcheri]|nr:hypothetical protein Bbelb_383380 [Branchiostoma belcheri]
MAQGRTGLTLQTTGGEIDGMKYGTLTRHLREKFRMTEAETEDIAEEEAREELKKRMEEVQAKAATGRRAGQAAENLREALDTHNSKRERLAELRHDIAAYLPNLNRSTKDILKTQYHGREVKNILTDVQTQLHREECPILVAGETSSGKSTFLNLLLGGDILPVAHQSSTSTICEVKYGETLKAVVHLREPNEQGQRQITIPLDGTKERQEELKSYMHLEGASREKHPPPAEMIEIFWPLPILKGGIVIVDSPGVGESKMMDQVVADYIPKAFAFLYIIDSSRAGGVQEDRLGRLLQLYKDNSGNFKSESAMFICNKWDQVPPEEQDKVKSDTLRKLSDNWPGLEGSQVFFVSTKKAVEPFEILSEDFSKVLDGLDLLLPKSLDIKLETQYRPSRVERLAAFWKGVSLSSLSSRLGRFNLVKSNVQAVRGSEVNTDSILRNYWKQAPKGTPLVDILMQALSSSDELLTDLAERQMQTQRDLMALLEDDITKMRTIMELTVNQTFKDTRSNEEILKTYEPQSEEINSFLGQLAMFHLTEMRKYEYDLDQIKGWTDPRNRLGGGSFGEVFRVQVPWKGAETLAALKLGLYPYDRISDNTAWEFLKEEDNLGKLKGDHIVEYYGTARRKERHGLRLGLVMELCEGTLESRIIGPRDHNPAWWGSDLEKQAAFSYTKDKAIQLCEGLKHIHDAGYIHRDLKLSNILVTMDDTVKLADVGLTKREDKITGTVAGTPLYAAPEVKERKVYDKSADIYSLGLILWEMWYGRALHEMEEKDDIYSKSIKEDLKRGRDIIMPRWRGTDPPTPEWTRLIHDCLKKDPKERPKIQECLDRISDMHCQNFTTKYRRSTRESRWRRSAVDSGLSWFSTFDSRGTNWSVQIDKKGKVIKTISPSQRANVFAGNKFDVFSKDDINTSNVSRAFGISASKLPNVFARNKFDVFSKDDIDTSKVFRSFGIFAFKQVGREPVHLIQDERKLLYDTSVMFHGSSGFDTFGDVVLMHTQGFPGDSSKSIIECGPHGDYITTHGDYIITRTEAWRTPSCIKLAKGHVTL